MAIQPKDRDAQYRLSHAAEALRRASPNLFAEFLKCLEQEAQGCLDNVLSAPTEELTRAQGKAIFATQLVKRIKGAAKDLEAIEARTKPK